MQTRKRIYISLKPLFIWAESVWQKLTKPFFLPASTETRRRIQLLSSLLLIYAALALIGTILARPDWAGLIAWQAGAAAVLYLLSRTRAYRLVTYAAILGLSALQIWGTIGREPAGLFEIDVAVTRLVPIMLLGIFLLSLRENILLIGVIFTAMLLLPVLNPEIDQRAVLSGVGFILICTAILIGNLRYRELVERDRRSELLEAKKLSDDVINGLPGIFFMCDTEGRLHRWNRKHEELLGFSSEQMSALRVSDLVDGDGREIIDRLLGRLEQTDRTEAEIELVSSSGRKIPFYLTALGEVIGDQFFVLAFGIDMTDLKRTIEAHRVLVDNSLQGLTIHQNGKIVFTNRAYASTLGYSLDELYAMSPESVARLIFVDDRRLLNLRMQAAQAGEEISPRYEARVVCKDGSIRWVEVTMSVIHFQGQPAIQTATMDITDRKLMEAEQARLIWELEAKNTELERFTYTVSHDLKAPLITIRGFLGFLQRDVALNNTARLKADIQRISEATEKMQRLLADLLRLSRIGRVTNPMEDVPFGQIVQDAAERVSGQIREHGVHMKIAGDLPPIHADRERIVEVIQNLLDNAVKFMGPQPEPHIEIGCKGTGQDGKPIFFVKDNGIGIAAQFHDRIFGLFNKLNPETDGTGIGLALVRRIIEIHEGRIWVESEPGKGSTFYFTLPLAKDH